LPPYSLRLESSRELSAEAVHLASDSNDALLQFGALRSRLYSLCGADSISEQLNVAEDMLRFDVDLTWVWHADAHLARYHASLQRADAAGAERALRAWTEFVTPRRLRRQLWHCERLRAQRLLDAGQLDEAERRFRELEHEAEHITEPLAAVYHRIQSVAIRVERTGKRLSSDQIAPLAVVGWVQRLPLVCVQRAQFAIELGQIDRAKREFRGLAADEFAAVRDEPFSLYTLVQLSAVAIDLAELDDARVLCRLLEPYAELIALSPIALSRGCVARYLGQLEARLDRWPKARSYFEQAEHVNARTGHALQRWHSQLGLAECLAHEGEHEQARTMAASVAAAAEPLGALALVSSARALMEHRPTKPGRMTTSARGSHRAPT
jgi:tetratricopeptide (TPR) repeat protein